VPKAIYAAAAWECELNCGCSHGNMLQITHELVDLVAEEAGMGGNRVEEDLASDVDSPNLASKKIGLTNALFP
jgi:hypothetical protein